MLTVCLEVGCSIKKAQVTVDDVIEQTEATRTENIVGETEDEKGKILSMKRMIKLPYQK